MAVTPSIDDGTDVPAIPTRTIVLLGTSGVALSAAAIVLLFRWGGLNDLQNASDPQEFVDVALANGREVRWASWADIVLLVPGYVLFVAALLACFRRRAGTPPGVRRASLLGTWAVVAGGVTDEVENAIVQLGLRSVDFTAVDPVDAGRPADGLITALNAATFSKLLFLFVAGVLLAALFVRAACLRGRRLLGRG